MYRLVQIKRPKFCQQTIVNEGICPITTNTVSNWPLSTAEDHDILWYSFEAVINALGVETCSVY